MLAYEHYLREARGLAPATILNYVPFVRAFLERRFGTGQVILSALRAGDVVGFVQHQAPGMNRKRAKLMTTALRSFLHHVRHCDEGMPDLVAAVPVVANCSMDCVPRAISPEQVQRLLTSIDRTTVSVASTCSTVPDHSIERCMNDEELLARKDARKQHRHALAVLAAEVTATSAPRLSSALHSGGTGRSRRRRSGESPLMPRCRRGRRSSSPG